ncbi:hypothetical protein MMC13_005530 [Lambiella insularis]|nr:hypothetical protein [Lambiella insularis]
MSAPQGPRFPGRGAGRSRSRSGPPSRRGAPSSRAAFQSPPSKAVQRHSTTTKNGVPNRAGRAIGPSRYRGNVQRPSSLSRVTPNDSADESWRDPTVEGNTEYKERISELWTTLKKRRERERRDAIKDGFLADPDKPTSLANAITPVGTCQDMCPEFERVERIHQNMVDGPEKTTAQFSDSKVPWEHYFVKRFRRSAAGYDEQLPSDIRPPLVLQKTLNYLLDDVIGGGQPLAEVHKFVWDRTRGIRNDFSIQQVTKTEDLRIAIDCFERIARFHILSLHQLSDPSRSNDDFDAFQEREQLNNTLLSLMYYYDDSRSKLTSANEAEFRAYCIIFEIQNQRPDLEDRAQSWPKPLLKDPRVQTALKLYAAGSNTSDDQGPLRPQTTFPIAQCNYGRFWSIVDSNAVSYLMACTAEIYFNYIRSITLNAIWKAYRTGGTVKLGDWILGDLVDALGFDTESQAIVFCEEHGFSIAERDDGTCYLDLTSVRRRTLIDTNPRRQQMFSRNLVEKKRFGRTLPAIINGLSAAQARANGLVDEPSTRETSPMDDADDDSMFVPQSTSMAPETTKASQKLDTGKDVPPPPPPPPPPSFNPFAGPLDTTPGSNPFQVPSATSSSAPPISIFGRPPPQTSPATSLGLDFSNTINRNLSSIPLATQAPSEAPNTTPAFRQSSFEVPPSLTWPPIPPVTQPDNVNAKPIILTASSAAPWFSKLQSPSSASNTSIPEQDSSKGDVHSQANNQPSTSASIFQFSPSASNSAQSPSSQATYSGAGQLSFDTHSTNNTTPQAIPSPEPSSFQHSSSLGMSDRPQATTKAAAMPLFNFPSAFPPADSLGKPPAVINISAPQTTLPQPPSQAQSPRRSQNATASSTPTLNRPQNNSTTMAQDKTGPPKPDPRLRALDQLANAVVCGNDGVLQQFVKYTIRPLIEKSVSKVKKEQERAKIAEIRHYLLGKKYLQRWKDNAWKKGLLRKGKERRRNFAQSMQALSRSTIERLNIDNKSQHRSAVDHSDQMPPPPIPEKPANTTSKSKSLAKGVENVKPQQKSHQDHEQDLSGSSKLSHSRPIKHHHRRSHTLGSASQLSKSSGVASSQSTFDPMAPQFDRESLLSESVLKKARRLVLGPTDTTRTDYFLLKARGIDPDTSVVPATRKRRISDLEQVNSKRASIMPSPASSRLESSSRPHSHSMPSFTPKKPANIRVDDEDDELFTQMRQVKEAMSESISWFREEREKSELSRSNSVSTEKPAETEKERRLREFKSTPSRTEVRLRETGAHGLLPKNWGQRKTDGETPNGQYPSPITGREFERPMGFHAFTTRHSPQESTSSQGINDTFRMASGASPDDAIEL